MCATNHHKICQNISIIGTIAKGFTRSEETEKIRTRLKGMVSKIEKIINENDDCRNNFEESKEVIPKQ